MSSPIATTPEPPYYAVIFTSQTGAHTDGYAQMAQRMVELAAEFPGYLGIESVREAAGLGITISYWQDEESIKNWKSNAQHRVAQETGQARWYENYRVRVARVEREYGT